MEQLSEKIKCHYINQVHKPQDFLAFQNNKLTHQRLKVMTKVVLIHLLIALLVALSLAQTWNVKSADTFYYQSAPQNYGKFGYGADPDGSFWMYYNVSGGVPQSIGFGYTIESLYAMPNRSTPPNIEPVLFFPVPDNVTNNPPIPYRLIGGYFEPDGHPPDSMLVPHFDVHYYFLTLDQLNNIQGAAPDAPGTCCTYGICLPENVYCNAIMPLPEGCCPPDYSSMALVIPNMGAHYMNASEPDMNGGPFIQDVAMGLWNGSLAFNEPMVNIELMINVSKHNADNRTCISFANAIPKYVPQAGWYPTQLCTGYWNDTETGYTELSNFVQYTQVCPTNAPRTSCLTPAYLIPKGCSCNFANDAASIRISTFALLIALAVALFSLSK